MSCSQPPPLNLHPKSVAVIHRKGYSLKNKLGEGAFGVVYRATKRNSKSTKGSGGGGGNKDKDGGEKSYAVKILDLSKLDGPGKAKFLPRELHTLMEAHHENLVHIYDIFRADQKIFIFMEYAANGDVAHYGVRHGGIADRLVARWFLQAAAGLHYLHQTLSTCHRDLKLDNMLLTADWVCKLTDFGESKCCFDARRRALVTTAGTICGTPPYMAVQLLEHIKYDAFKADLWSMGVCLFVMLFGKFPFHYHDRKRAVEEMHRHPEYLRSQFAATSKALPPEAYRLIEELLQPEEARRCSTQTILENSFLLQRRGNDGARFGSNRPRRSTGTGG